MGGRSKPNWGVYVGGPLNGRRRILHPNLGPGAHEVVYTDGSKPGTIILHEYRVTDEYRTGGFHEAKALKAVFVRTLPGEMPRPPVRFGHCPAHMGPGARSPVPDVTGTPPRTCSGSR